MELSLIEFCVALFLQTVKYGKIQILNVVHSNRLKLIELFNELMGSPDWISVREAQGYLNNLDLEDFPFVFL